MASVKTIGSSGQIALGKEHAGRQALVEEVEPGFWVVKLGQFVPDSERWLYAVGVERELDEAIAWAEAHPAEPTDLDVFERRTRE